MLKVKILKRVCFLLLILVLAYVPVLYGVLSWWPHGRWGRIVSGPIAIIADAGLVCAAARRSKWWLLALVAPLFGIMVLLSRGV